MTGTGQVSVVSAVRVGGLRRRLLTTQAAFGGTALVICLVAPLVGPTPISLGRVFDGSIPFADNVDAQILFIARLPRALAGALVGGALAAAGVVLQALLRNPLATPFTLGVSAGASLGAMTVIIFGVPLTVFGVPAVPLASFVGSLAAVGIVYSLARLRRQGLSTNVLLLAGVTLNSLFSAIIMFVQYLADFSQSFQAIRWLMGNLDVSGYEPIVWALPLLVAAAVGFAWLPLSLNLLTLGTEHAATRGCQRASHTTPGVLQRVARDGRSGIAGRPNRVYRHHRAAHRASRGRC